MTEKQFKCHLAVVGVHIGVGTDEHDLTGDECRDLLNELSTENRQLKQLQNELYDFRMVYNALLFNNWHKHNEIEVYKSTNL